TDILVSAAYKLTMNANRYDLAAALSILIFLIIGTLSLINMNLTGAFKEVD
ncbi:MAG: sugar ABC transporter permease, partial [Caldanaerobacter sp.]